MGPERGETPEDRFDAVVTEMSDVAGVSPPAGGRRFGAQALRRHGRIIAMLAGDRLVVKLPRARVDQLVDDGHGFRFDPRGGTPMREWLSLSPDSPLTWSELTREAIDSAR